MPGVAVAFPPPKELELAVDVQEGVELLGKDVLHIRTMLERLGSSVVVDVQRDRLGDELADDVCSVRTVRRCHRDSVMLFGPGLLGASPPIADHVLDEVQAALVERVGHGVEMLQELSVRRDGE